MGLDQSTTGARIAAATVAMLALASCSTGGAGDAPASAQLTAEGSASTSSPAGAPPSTASPAPSTAAPTSTASSAAPTTPSPSSTSSGIRAVDFGEQTFDGIFGYEGDEGQVRLRGGKGSFGMGGATTLKDHPGLKDLPRYSDVDGDGDEDALVSVESTQGNGVSLQVFVWLWDQKAGRAVQQLPAVVNDGRCGDFTTGLKVTGQGRISITYADKSRDPGSCAETPSVTSTRVVSVRGDRPVVQVEPFLSTLDWCNPAEANDDVWRPDQSGPGFKGLYAGPSRSSGLLVPADQIAYYNTVDPSQNAELDTPFVLVWYMPKGRTIDDLGDRWPCGWLPRT